MDYNRYCIRTESFLKKNLVRCQLSITPVMTTRRFLNAKVRQTRSRRISFGGFPFGLPSQVPGTSRSLLLKSAPLTGILNWLK